MARSFSTSSDKITAGTTAIPTTGTIALRIKPTWVKTDSVDHIFWNVYNSGSQFFRGQKYSDNTLYVGWYNSGEYRVSVGSGGYTTNQNAWNTFVLTWGGSGSVLYLNGSQIGTAGAPTTFTTTGNREFGYYNDGLGNSGSAGGDLADIAIWSAVLSAAEVASYQAGVTPPQIRPASLTDYLPILGRFSPEPNLRGGTEGTVTGTSVADHPRIIQPRRRALVSVPTSAPAATTSHLSCLLGVGG